MNTIIMASNGSVCAEAWVSAAGRVGVRLVHATRRAVNAGSRRVRTTAMSVAARSVRTHRRGRTTMRRTLFAAAAAVCALGGIVTAAPAVADGRCLFQGDWKLLRSAAVQRAFAEHLGRARHLWRLDVAAVDVSRWRQPATLPAVRPAAMSSDRRRHSGGASRIFISRKARMTGGSTLTVCGGSSRSPRCSMR